MGDSLTKGALKLVLMILLATLGALLLLLLFGPWLFVIAILVAVAIIALRLFPSIALPKLAIFTLLRMLWALIRELPRLAKALEATSGALRAAATGLNTGKKALDRVEADLSSSGALLKTVKVPVPPPSAEKKKLSDFIRIVKVPGVTVDDNIEFVTGFTFSEETVLSAAGDLLIRQANDIRATSGVIDQQVTTLNDAAQVLHDVAQALKAAEG